MRLRRIALRNFRNLRAVELLPAGGYNLLLGPNGAGKSNLCEAIYFAARGELLKGERQRELIAWGETLALIELEVDEDRLRIVLDGAAQVKRVELNGKPARAAQLQERLQAVAFTADELQIAKGEPQARRAFLDGAIGQLDREYRYRSRRYEEIVRRKNALLRQEPLNEELLAVYEDELVEHGAFLITRRLTYLEEFNRELESLHARLRLGMGPLRLDYLSSLPGMPRDRRELGGWLSRGLAAKAAEERRRGLALVGPHRDDLQFTSNSVDLRKFGSQGEQRAAIVQAKLAQFELHRRRVGQYPILILDDLLSELDPRAGQLFLGALPSGVQAFLTATEMRPGLSELAERVYLVDGGEIKERA
ncbi:MAG: DNA replication and repair protein RecF [Candidatus Acetothermia bacterium]|jgi:DNA replication and repair protein RecF|nr:DNA replication and repair protein RecF [Candidatus Acetothermia bacterium]MDH7505645.1 DNA replication and repair protein RecF [Candidatus Acetothermia bacterium]